MHITFERATHADAEALVNAQIAAFHHDAVLHPGIGIGGPPGYDSVEHTRTKLGQALGYKMVDSRQIMGGFVVWDMGQGRMHLDLLFIHPAYHNRGIGTRAMRFLEHTYPATRWTLNTPAWAIRNQHFYEKLGYVKVREQALPDIILFWYEKLIG
jgi:ribosomal protein S18 acetylase RimI-like enzyme